MPPKKQPEPEEEEEEEPPPPPLSTTGLFYLYYKNDSGRAISTGATKEVVSTFFEALADAEAMRQAEFDATLHLQASSRRMLQRRRFGHERQRAITLERVYRGHLGRLRYEDSQEERDAWMRRAFWDSNAVLVQKIWRGFSSRKHVHNFFLRKAYLQSVAERGAAVHDILEKHHQTLAELEGEREESERLAQFEGVVSSLHHLLSTQSCPGLYNSPYQQMAPLTVYGLPIEEHLRNASPPPHPTPEKLQPPLPTPLRKTPPRSDERESRLFFAAGRGSPREHAELGGRQYSALGRGLYTAQITCAGRQVASGTLRSTIASTMTGKTGAGIWAGARGGGEAAGEAEGRGGEGLYAYSTKPMRITRVH